MSTSILQKILNKTTQFIETLQKKVENREQIQKYRSQKKKNKVNNTTEIFADVNLRLKIKLDLMVIILLDIGILKQKKIKKVFFQTYFLLVKKKIKQIPM